MGRKEGRKEGNGALGVVCVVVSFGQVKGLGWKGGVHHNWHSAFDDCRHDTLGT